MHVDAEGTEWFLTGDVACIDADGYMKITDRSKGKWGSCGWCWGG
jgi:long-subunit acyl-CoA synthetase (AMP-forming)